jgi:3',5'-cyclic AMP phosphodiesterase CpdA
VFSFAHLSDPHLSNLQGVSLRKLANKRLLGYLSWRHRRRIEHRREVLDALVKDMQGFAPDHTVVTGDLTHIGLPSEFIEVRRWLDGVGRPEQVTIVPGNHDRYVPEDWQQTFQHWLPYMQADDYAATCDDGPERCLFPTLRVRAGVAFIGLSSSRPSAPLLAVGSLGAEQLDKLPALLQQTREQGLFRIIMLHHPPDSATVSWRKRLTDATRLRQIIAEHGAELILHGHAHSSCRSVFSTPAGQAPVLGVPSASAISDSAGSGDHARYHLHRVQREPGGWCLQTTVRGCAHTGRGFTEERQFEDFIAAP